MKNLAYKLKGSQFGINEQFPAVIEDKRRMLYPVMKKKKREGHAVKMVRDRLYVDGQLYHAPNPQTNHQERNDANGMDWGTNATQHANDDAWGTNTPQHPNIDNNAWGTNTPQHPNIDDNAWEHWARPQRQTRRELPAHDVKDVKFLVWNINGGLNRKLNDSAFSNYICTYDVICLTECWIEKNYSYILPGYTATFIPRELSKSKLGGGIALFIKDTFNDIITLERIYFDTLVWLKIGKECVNGDEDLYICCLYIPPDRTVFYTLYNCDLFFELESQIARFS